MSYYIAITLGLVMCLGVFFGTFVYVLTISLNNKDSSNVDPRE